MTEKTYFCWDEGWDEIGFPVGVVARSAQEAAAKFAESDWDGGVNQGSSGTERFFVYVRDDGNVSRWQVTVKTTTEFTARRAKGRGEDT